jgi:hypothetical protein
MKEAALQRKCIAYAKSQGWLGFKWASPAHRGVPDCLFFKSGSLVIVEFKSPSGKGRLSPLQEKTITDLKDKGFPVFVVNSFEYFEAILDGKLR